MSNVIRFTPKKDSGESKERAASREGAPSTPPADAHIVDFATAAVERDRATLKMKRQLLLELTRRGALVAAYDLARDLVVEFHQNGDHEDARGLATKGIPSLLQRIRYGR